MYVLVILKPITSWYNRSVMMLQFRASISDQNTETAGVAHALGMPGTFSPPPRLSDPDMQYGTCVTHVPWCMLGSLTNGFLCQWRGKRSRHSRRMRNQQFYVSGKRPMVMITKSNGNIFRISGPLCGAITDHRWIPFTKASDAELWRFL